jgi:CheY-like chemotaxis protein
MDDEEYIRKSTTKLLTHLGYEATAAVDGNEAESLFRQAREAGEPFHVVILDLTVPGGAGGKQALEKLKDIDPKVKALLSSGYVDDPIMTDYEHYGFSGVITKPYEVEELSEMLRAMLGEGNTT